MAELKKEARNLINLPVWDRVNNVFQLLQQKNYTTFLQQLSSISNECLSDGELSEAEQKLTREYIGNMVLQAFTGALVTEQESAKFNNQVVLPVNEGFLAFKESILNILSTQDFDNLILNTKEVRMMMANPFNSTSQELESVFAEQIQLIESGDTAQSAES